MGEIGTRYHALSVSIHAPVKGATARRISSIRAGSAVSIHAPVKGATRINTISAWNQLVSIHAPVKGATGETPIGYQR